MDQPTRGYALTQRVEILNAVLNNYYRTSLLFSAVNSIQYVYDSAGEKTLTIPAKGTASYGVVSCYGSSPQWACYVSSYGISDIYNAITRHGPIYLYFDYSAPIFLYSNGSSIPDASFNPTRSGYGNALVAKFNENGTFEWAGRIVGNNLNITDVVVENQNVYVSAYTTNTMDTTATAYDGSGNATSINASSSNSFIVKYLSSGTVESFANVRVSNSASLNCIALGSDAVYCGGQGSLGNTFTVRDFNANVVTLPAVTNGAYVCKLNAYGNVTGTQWVAKVVGNPLGQYAETTVAVATDSLEHVYSLVQYIWYGEPQESPKVYEAESTTPSKILDLWYATGTSLILVKLNANGAFKWAASITGTGVSGASRLAVYDDEVYVQIKTTAAVTIHDASGVATSVAAASIRQVVCKYTSEGQLAWATYMTGSSASNVVFENNYVFASAVHLKMTYSNVTIYGTNAPLALPTYGSVLLSYNAAGEVAVVSRISN
jgi:hypothetical protein